MGDVVQFPKAPRGQCPCGATLPRFDDVTVGGDLHGCRVEKVDFTIRCACGQSWTITRKGFV